MSLRDEAIKAMARHVCDQVAETGDDDGVPQRFYDEAEDNLDGLLGWLRENIDGPLVDPLAEEVRFGSGRPAYKVAERVVARLADLLGDEADE